MIMIMINSEQSVVICDSKMSTMRAVQRDFRHATLRLYFFLLKQNAWRKMQELGLQTVYNDEDDATIEKSFGELLCLAFVADGNVSACFHTVLPTTSRWITNFVKYFEATYIGITARGRWVAAAEIRFPPHLWNQFDAARSNEPRTNSNTMLQGLDVGRRIKESQKRKYYKLNRYKTTRYCIL
ncbi:hypothetical protein ANN_19295 [Periplaneta americana]|uniref:Uncharacterized protein n=1 Tax=Periplaneta americana TaxID=6978 RepID=A0ABQ8S9K1_PERAM|nr:hypothetical protein ANN_19295 [Periplaneta americana]